MYYCLECEKEIEKKGEGPLFHCPICKQSEFLYHFNAKETNFLNGKTIQSVYNNMWKDISKIIVFTDGTRASVEHPCSDLIEIVPLEHDYEDEIDDEDNEDEE